GAAVRIAMTACSEEGDGKLVLVKSESSDNADEIKVQLEHFNGKIFADLRTGVDFSKSVQLNSNSGISNRGMIPHGEGFLVTPEQGQSLDNGALVRPYRNNKDLTSVPRGVMVIDTFGLTESELKERYPASWQWLYERVKPERDQNKRPAVRDRWWLFGEQRKVLR